MSVIWQHFARNKVAYGTLLLMVGGLLYTWGPDFEKVSQVLALLGAFLTGSKMPSDRDVKLRQGLDEKLAEKIRSLE